MKIQIIISLLLTLQPHNLAHPQPFSDEQATPPFRWESPMGASCPKAMDPNGPLKANFHR